MLVLSVAATHAHGLVELPDDKKKVRLIMGECKTTSSHAVRQQLPGQVWATGGKFERIEDAGHRRNAYQYLLDQEGAWIWDFKHDTQEESEKIEDPPQAQG